MVHPNQVLFTEGVGHIFKLWQALNIAVANEWGGQDSKEKRQWMMEVIVGEFGKQGKKLEVFDLEDILMQIMSDEFETVLEDDSAHKVANDLIHLYKEILAGDLTRLEKLREATNRQPAVPTTTCAPSSSEDEGSESDDDEAGDAPQGNEME